MAVINGDLPKTSTFQSVLGVDVYGGSALLLAMARDCLVILSAAAAAAAAAAVDIAMICSHCRCCSDVGSRNVKVSSPAPT